MGDIQHARLVLGPQIERRGKLVLGDDGGGVPALPDVLIAGAPTLPGLCVRAGLLRCAVAVAATAALPGMGVRAGGLGYLSNTQRPTVAAAGAAWQVAAAGDGAQARPTHQATAARPAAAQARWQRGRDGAAQVVHPLPGVLAALALPGVAPWRAAQARHEGAAWLHQQALRTALAHLATWQEGQRRHMPVGFGHQDANRLPRAWAAAPWQAGHALRLGYMGHHQAALALHRPGRAPWQEGVPPPAGMSVRPVTPPKPPCYDPATLGRIVFTALADGTGRVVFVCERSTSPEQGVVVPVRRVYIVLNTITLTRVDNGAPLHARGFSASLDVDSWTWQWSAALHESAEPHLARQANGRPPEVLASVNGQPLRLVVERVQRDERFLPQVRFNVSGRGRAAVLASPWAPVLQHGGQATQRTAEQLAAEVLTINNVGIGWGIDWQLPAWTVPAGLWTFSGSYMEALADIASAVGAAIQPHPTDAVLRVMARYPRPPWEWDQLAPDYLLPRDAVQTLGTEFVDKPAYNGVFVGGTQAGGFGPVVRGGTVGDVLAPQATHVLITDPVAQRLRGTAVLADTGRQRRVSLSMQVLPETGLIVPGKLVQVGSGAGAMLGMVRATAIEWARPRLRQNIELEVHEL